MATKQATVTGERIRQCRLKLNYSQEELSEIVGTSQRQVSSYETGQNDPTGRVLAALANALNTTADYLLGLTDIEDRPLRSSGDLTDDERQILELYREKEPQSRRKYLDILKVV